MSMPQRPSPKGKRVSLFITCIMDLIYPESGLSVVEVLERLGVEVDFPEGQTCCGQPPFNAGYRADAAAVAKQFLRAFEHSEVIVTASGSCAAMVRHEYTTLFADDPEWLARAERAAAKIWEISEFLVDGLGITDLGARLPEKRTFTFHDSCHGLRMMGLGSQARELLSHVENAELVEMEEHDVCCGFGGLFSVKLPEVSGAMLEKKMIHINESPADTVLLGDASCMMHINGGLSREGSPKRAKHLIDVLAEGVRDSHKESNEG